MELIAHSLCIAIGAPAKVAREGWPSLRGPLTLAAWAGPVAALLDALENAVHAGMVMGLCSPDCVSLQYPVTLAKWALVVVGLLVSLLALAGLKRAQARGA